MIVRSGVALRVSRGVVAAGSCVAVAALGLVSTAAASASTDAVAESPFTAGAPCWNDDYSTAPQTLSGTAGQTVTTVRFGVHDEFERFVLQLDGDTKPAVRAATILPFERPDWVDPTPGGMFLKLTVGALLNPSLPAVTEQPGTVVQRTTSVDLFGDEDGEHDWYLRLATPDTPFRLFWLPGPSRVVVDVLRPAAPVPEGAWTTAPQSWRSMTAPTHNGPKSIRTGAHRSFDRIVFDGAWLRVPDVRMTCSTAANGQRVLTFVTTVSRPQRVSVPPGATRIESIHDELIDDGDPFVNYTHVWLTGDQPEFRVFRLQNPPRLVVDIR